MLIYLSCLWAKCRTPQFEEKITCCFVYFLDSTKTIIVNFRLELSRRMLGYLEPTLNVKGQNVPTSAIPGDHGNVRICSSKKPKLAPKYGLHHTWEHTWQIRNGSHGHDGHVQRFQDSNERRDWQLLLQVIDFVNKCEAMFSTKRLKISKCTLIKCLLETNFASSVKPRNVKCCIGYTRPFFLLDSIVVSLFLLVFLFFIFLVCVEPNAMFILV